MSSAVDQTSPLLDIENLRVSFHTPAGIVRAVRGLSFTLGRERLGIVGESGSGKSMTGRAILDLIPYPGEVTADKMFYRGQNLQTMNKTERRHAGVVDHGWRRGWAFVHSDRRCYHPFALP